MATKGIKLADMNTETQAAYIILESMVESPAYHPSSYIWLGVQSLINLDQYHGIMAGFVHKQLITRRGDEYQATAFARAQAWGPQVKVVSANGSA